MEKTQRLRIQLLSTGRSQYQYCTSFLVNDVLAIDAGSIGFYGSPKDQARLRDVVLTHSHADHLASLPMLLENTYQERGRRLRLWGSRAVLDCLEDCVFNNRIWPRLARSCVDMQELEKEHPVRLGEIEITAVEVNHTVPTFGLLVEAGDSTVVIPSDTGPTKRIWDLARERENLRAVLLEASFPDSLAELAEASKHLTPKLFAKEVQKLGREVPIIAIHIKSLHRQQVIAELKAMDIPGLQIGDLGKEYSW